MSKEPAQRLRAASSSSNSSFEAWESTESLAEEVNWNVDLMLPDLYRDPSLLTPYHPDE